MRLYLFTSIADHFNSGIIRVFINRYKGLEVMAKKTINGKQWTVDPKDAFRLTRTVDGKEVAVFIGKALKNNRRQQCMGTYTNGDACEGYLGGGRTTTCYLCGTEKPKKEATTGSTSSAAAVGILDADVELIASLVVAIQNDAEPTKPVVDKPTLDAFAKAARDRDGDTLLELADTVAAWDHYESFSNIGTRQLNRYKKIINQVLAENE